MQQGLIEAVLGGDEPAVLGNAQRRYLHEAADPRLDTGLRQRQRRSGMHGLEGLRALLTQDAGGVDHRIHSLQ